MLIRSFTQKLNSNLTNLNINNYLHKLTFFAILQNITLKPVQYLIRDEEVLLHQKHDSNPILADYGTDHISIRINDKDNDNIFNPLDSFSFKSVPPFQSISKHPSKNTISLFTNNLFYSMILTISVVMMIMFTEESEKIKLLLHLLLLSLPKHFLQPQTQNLILTLQMQSKHNNLSNFHHIYHKQFHFMTHHSLNTKTTSRCFPTRRLLFRYKNS